MNSCRVKVCDSIMGSGKSCAAINYMNKNAKKRFLYITPFLTEVDRIKEFCPSLDFCQPIAKDGKSKLSDIRLLLLKKRNIVATHALFLLFTEELIDLCRKGQYILIMDEAVNVIREYNITKDDCKVILERFAYTDDESGLLHWKEEQSNYKGKYSDVKRVIEMGAMFLREGNVMLWVMPKVFFDCFSEVYILTYMFEGQLQKYYFDLFEIQYEHICVVGNNIRNYCFSTNHLTIDLDFKEIIHICEHQKINQIGDSRYALSKNWYVHNSGNEETTTRLKNNIFNYFHNIINSPSANNMWTTFNSYKKQLSGKGYTKGFLPCNSRATNEYKDRTCIAYCVNRYVNTVVKNFFISNGIRVDEDMFALSEMLQFIWRSAIREGHEIWVYVPSRRMRELLIYWINSVSKGVMI